MTRNPKGLSHFARKGIKLIPTYNSGATLGSWKDPYNYTSDIDKIKAYWKDQGIRRFQLHPADNKLICLDIDRKGGKDGLRQLQRLLTEQAYLPRYIKALDYLAGDKDSWTTVDGHFPFTCWTQTPSGGFHIYFKHDGQLYRSGDIAAGVEVVHYNHLITAPGSRKGGKPYILFGSLENLRSIPPVLLKLFTPHSSSPTHISWEYKRREFGDLTLDEITEIIDQQGEYSPLISRNRYSYELAKFARKQGYPAADVEQYIIDHWEAEDFTAAEIRQSVQSAFRR